MFQRATISSQVFIKNKTQHTKSVNKQELYSDTLNFVEDSLLSQADIRMSQHQPLWSTLFTRPLQTNESFFTNKAMGLITLFGPLSKYSTFPSQVIKHWSVNKNTKQSLIWHGNFTYKNKRVETENTSILRHSKRKSNYNSKIFHFFDSLIRTQSLIELQNVKPPLHLHSKDSILKVRVLPKNTVLKVRHFFFSSPKNQTICQFSTKNNSLYGKTFFETHIDLFGSTPEITKKIQIPYQIDFKQKNTLFLDLVNQGSKKSSDWIDPAWFIHNLINTRENNDWKSRSCLTISTEQRSLENRLLLFKKREEKYPTQLIADGNRLTSYYNASQIEKYNPFNNFQDTENKFQKKHPQNYYSKKSKKTWEKNINSREIDNQCKQKLDTSIQKKSKDKIYDFFYTWKDCLLQQTGFPSFQKKHHQYWLDQYSLVKLSHFFSKILSLRGTIYPNFLLAPSLQLIGIELWWVFFVACGIGLVIQYDTRKNRELSPPISLSPLSIWRLYWNPKLTDGFWPQMTKSFYLRAKTWIQPRFMQLENLFRLGISPLVALSIQLKWIAWMPFKVGRRVVNIIECLENFTEIFSDKITLTSIKIHTKINFVLVQQLNKAHRLSKRLGPSYDDALVPIVDNPITKVSLFFTRQAFYNAVWLTLVPLRFVGLLFSLAWRVWRFVPQRVKQYFITRANEQRFQAPLEKAINYKGMLAGAQHALDHPGAGLFVRSPIRTMSLFFRMSCLCDLEYSPLIDIHYNFHGVIQDFTVPKSSLFIEPIGSRRNEWFRLVSEHWKLPLIHLRLQNTMNKDSLTMSGRSITVFGQSSGQQNGGGFGGSITATASRGGFASSFGGGSATTIATPTNPKANAARNTGDKSAPTTTITTGRGGGGGDRSDTSSERGFGRGRGGTIPVAKSDDSPLNPIFQRIREGEVISEKAKLPSMDRPQTITEDNIIRQFMIATAAIPCIFVVDGLNFFYDLDQSQSYLAVRELRERSTYGGLSYEEKMFGIFDTNTGYLTVDYWEILGMPNHLEKEAEEEDYELEELEDDPPEIREAKLLLKENAGERPEQTWVDYPPDEGGLTGWEIMEAMETTEYYPDATLLYILWLLDRFPRTRYGIRFGVANLLTIKEPLLRKRRWHNVYTMEGFTWVERERILQTLITNMGAFRLQGHALEQVLPRSKGYTLAEMHSFANEIALCKAQINLHLKWGKEWAWDDSLLLKKINKPHKPASGSDAASDFFLWQKATYVHDLHQLTSEWTIVEKAIRSLMRQEDATMSGFSPYFLFEHGRAHIYQHLSKWVVESFFFPGITRFPAYNAGNMRFRYSYLDEYPLEETPYSIEYRRDPTSTATWSEIIRSLAFIVGGDLYYECVENPSQQPISKKQKLAHHKGITRKLNQLHRDNIEMCWQLLWGLAKQNPLLPFTNPIHSFHKRVEKNLYKKKLYDTFIFSNEIRNAQAREENTLSLYKSLPLLLFRFPGLYEEDTLGGKEHYSSTRRLLPYFFANGMINQFDDFRPLTMVQPSIQVMVKDEELLHLNFVYEPLYDFIFYHPRKHYIDHHDQVSLDEYGRPLEVEELRESEDKKTRAAFLIQRGGFSLKDAPVDLELREFLTTEFEISYDIIRAEEDKVWHLDPHVPKAIRFNDLHFLHAWIPFFQWTYTEKRKELPYQKIWVAPYSRLQRIAIYVDSYVVNDFPAIHQRILGRDFDDQTPGEEYARVALQNLKDNKWKAHDKKNAEVLQHLSQMKLSDDVLIMINEKTDLLTTPDWVRGREYRRKVRMKKRSRSILSALFDSGDPHTDAGALDDPAMLAAEPLHLVVEQRAEILASGMLLSTHETGVFWRNAHAVSTGMHRGWDLTYSTSDLRWLLFNETDRTESDFYTILYEIEKSLNSLIVWTWPQLQNVFSLMQSRATWAQEETQRSNWKLSMLPYSAKIECEMSAARLETEELNAIHWNSSAKNLQIQAIPGSLPFDFIESELADQLTEKKAQAALRSHSNDFAGRLAYNKPGWRVEGEFFNRFNNS
jgi:hypothetical protein